MPATATALTTPPDLGYWDVNITIARGAQGHEAQFTWAIYSGNPTKIIYDEWSFNPDGGNITSLRNTRDFSVTVGANCGNGMGKSRLLFIGCNQVHLRLLCSLLMIVFDFSGVTLKQQVYINNRQYWIVGKASPSFKVISANGRGGATSFRANATLDSGAVDACGNPLNPTF